MDRILVDTASVLTVTFQIDGVAADPSPVAATVTVTADDGTVLIAAQAATHTGAGAFSYILPLAQNTRLDVLTVEWASSLGTITTYVEVVGGFLFTIAQARAQPGLSAKTVADITDARTYVETELENACGLAFVPRYRREQVNGYGTTAVLLHRPHVRAIRSVTLDGASIGAPALATLLPDVNGLVYYPDGWTRGFRNYEVAYEHGLDFPSPGATVAALTWARDYLIKGPISDRATSFATEDGTFQMAMPGMRGSVSGLPVVDAFIQQNNLIAGIA